MTHRLLLLVILPLLLLFTHACGQKEDETRELELSDLELMATLPDEALQVISSDLSLDPASGVRSNATAADLTLDPDDTQESLTSAGRVNGYSRAYTGEQEVVATRVDLWRDSEAASQGLEEALGSFERAQGKLIDSVVVRAVSRFRVENLGDESGGVRIRATESGRPRYQTSVYFRAGRLLGYVTINRGADTDDTELAIELAEKLAAQITAVLGEGPEVPVARIGPSLEYVRSTTKLKLTKEELRSGELGQIFEHVDRRGLIDSASFLFPGEDGGVNADIARFETEDIAKRAWESIKRGELEGSASTGRALDLKNVGDRATGYVFPPSAGNEFATTVIAVQTGRVLFVVMVLSHDPAGLEQAARALAGSLADQAGDSGLTK